MRVPDYTADWAEPQGHERLWQVAAAHLKIKPTGDEAVGDVLLFRMRRGAVAKHLGLQSVVGSQATFVHAYQGHGVVESPLSAPWRAKVVARFALPQEEF
jgi:NlpC/P60 family putative phage cell wall peptidase